MTDKVAGPDGSELSEGLGPLVEVAWLYHDAARAEDANPLLHSTLVVMAADRRPHCRNETALYALSPEEVAAVNKHRARKVWQTRQTHLCRCDHNEYCRHCFPERFRPGGVWHGLGA